MPKETSLHAFGSCAIADVNDKKRVARYTRRITGSVEVGFELDL